MKTSKKTTAKYPLAEHFLKILREEGSVRSDLKAVYYHLFSLLDQEELENTLEYLKTVWNGTDDHFGKEGKECWFTVFHKMIRQTDFFQGIYKKIELKLMTKKELSEFWFLNDKVTKVGYDKTGEPNELFNSEYRRYLELSEKKRSQKREKSVGGHLDMVLWNLIHADTKDVLYKTFEEFFKENEDD